MDDSIAICTATHVGWKEPNYRVGEIFFLIDSINACDEVEKIELSIVDCSNARPDFAGLIRERWKGNRLIYTYDPMACNHPDMPGKLWISYAFNQAVRQCKAERIFTCGMDAVFPPDFVELYNNRVKSKKIWNPIVRFANKWGEPLDYWRRNAHGLVGMLKEDYWAIGGQNEKYTMPKWFYGMKLSKDKDYLRRGHDTDFFHQIRVADYKIAREDSEILSLDHPEIDPTITLSEFVP